MYSSTVTGHEPKANFPGYLSSETSTLTNYNSYSSFDPRAGSSDFLRKDVSIFRLIYICTGMIQVMIYK